MTQDNYTGEDAANTILSVLIGIGVGEIVRTIGVIDYIMEAAQVGEWAAWLGFVVVILIFRIWRF